MKRVATVVLVLLLSSVLTTLTHAQIFMGPNSQKQAEKAAEKEKKTQLRNEKKRQKAMRKYEEREQKAERRKR
jgi:nitrate reductase cytochrome c-type subunit